MRRSLHHSPFGGFNAIVSQLMDVREQHQHLGRNCSQLSRNKASLVTLNLVVCVDFDEYDDMMFLT